MTETYNVTPTGWIVHGIVVSVVAMCGVVGDLTVDIDKGGGC